MTSFVLNYVLYSPYLQKFPQEGGGWVCREISTCWSFSTWQIPPTMIERGIWDLQGNPVPASQLRTQPCRQWDLPICCLFLGSLLAARLTLELRCQWLSPQRRKDVQTVEWGLCCKEWEIGTLLRGFYRLAPLKIAAWTLWHRLATW